MTIGCPDCGTLQDLPRLQRGEVALCRGCHGRLERLFARGTTVALLCSLGTLLLLFPANALTLFTLRFVGQPIHSRLGSGVLALFAQGWVLVPLAVALFALILPFVRYGLLVLALGSLRLDYRPSWLGRVFRWSLMLDAWAMPEVFLAACIIGYERVVAQAPIIHIGAGGYCFLAAALLAMLSRALLDRRTVWRAIAPERSAPEHGAVISCTSCDLVLPLDNEGRRCPRCGLRLWARRPSAWNRTAALVIAGMLLYLPANLYPMSVTHMLGSTQSYRIIDGIDDLIRAGLWPLGAIVFVTSLAIPVTKLIGLAWCLVSVRWVRWRTAPRLVLKTHVFRVIDEIGRWSCIDPFIIAVTVPIMHYRGLLRIDAGGAATSFISVVVITMTASRLFDPRLLWDAALERARG